MRKLLSCLTMALMFLAVCSSQESLAQQKYTIKEMTPEIEKALQDRRDRYDRLAELKQQGVVGENNRGHVEVLVEQSQAEELVQNENEDRRIIYEAIAAQNGLGKQTVSVIENVFAEVQRNKANPGDMIQTEDGRWVKK